MIIENVSHKLPMANQEKIRVKTLYKAWIWKKNILMMLWLDP